ncbi:hypothetical protein GCM10010432_45830 [Catellatospora methionotrophica]
MNRDQFYATTGSLSQELAWLCDPTWTQVMGYRPRRNACRDPAAFTGNGSPKTARADLAFCRISPTPSRH